MTCSYDPATGQFLSRDPIAAVTGQPYGYANGSPLGRTDPSGLLTLPSLRQVATRYVAAVDTMTGGLTADARGAFGLNGGLDTCSYDYLAAAGVMDKVVRGRRCSRCLWRVLLRGRCSSRGYWSGKPVEA